MWILVWQEVSNGRMHIFAQALALHYPSHWPISCQINTDAQPLCTYVMMLAKDVDAHIA